MQSVVGEIRAGTQGRDPEAGTEAEATENAVDWLALHGSLSLIEASTTCPGVKASTVGWALPHQSLIKKIDVSTGQSYEAIPQLRFLLPRQL